jgi:PilZ domain
MQTPAASVELRKHPRAQVRLLARIRSRGPFGMRLEVTETIDVSREGLLVHRREECNPSQHVWVAFPFDASSPATTQLEVPARIVRVQQDPIGGFRVALSLEMAPRALPTASGDERRKSVRSPLSLPIFVRRTGTPWPEESMTQDISDGGVRFETSQIFAPGDTLHAMIPSGDWPKRGELTGRVVRVVAAADQGFAPVASVAVQWTKWSQPRGAKTSARPSAPAAPRPTPKP